MNWSMLSKFGLGLFCVGFTILFFAILVYADKGLTEWTTVPGGIGFGLMILGLMLGFRSALAGFNIKPEGEEKQESIQPVTRGKIYPPSGIYNRKHRRKK